MLIKKLDIITEFFIWLLLFGLTFSNAMVEIGMGFIIFIFIVKRVYLMNFKLPKTPINLVIGIFFVLILVSLLRSAYPKESLKVFLRLLRYTSLYFAVVDFLKVNQEARLKRTFWAIIFIASFTFLNGIFQDIFGFDILRHRELIEFDYLHRVSSSFVHPNDFGAYIILMLSLTFCFLSSRVPKRQRIILGAVCLLGLYCLIRTSSRSAWLGFFSGTIIYFFFYKRKITILIPAIIILLIILSPHGFNRITSTFSLGESTSHERIQLWKGTWNMIKEHPILGFGINTFSKYFPLYKPTDYPDVRYAHNSYLQMWSEIGLIGLVIFLGLIFMVFKCSFSKIKEKLNRGYLGLVFLGLLSGYASFLVQSAFDTNLYSLSLMALFWLFTAWIISLNNFLEDNINA